MVFGLFVRLETLAVGVGGVSLVAAGALGASGRDVSWLPVLAIAVFAAGLPGVLGRPADWEQKMKTALFPRLWSARGASVVLLGSGLAYLTSFAGLMALGVEPGCARCDGLFDPASERLRTLLLIGASAALVVVGLGASLSQGRWGLLVATPGVLVPIALFLRVALSSSLGMLVLGALWTVVGYVMWRHRGAIT